MPIEQVRFYSHGAALAGTLMLPDGTSPDRPVAAVVQGPGWLGLRDAKLYQPYHDALLAAGIAVLVFDYRGFGDSEGDATLPRSDGPGRGLPQRGDLPARPARRSTPGDSARSAPVGPAAATRSWRPALDDRFKAMVSQVPIADGRDWLHRMRPEHEWLAFLERLRVGSP